MEGISAGGFVYNTFDSVDFVLMTDKTFEDAMEQIDEDEKNNMLDFSAPLKEAAEEFETETIVIDGETDPDDLPVYSVSPHDDEATQFLATYQQLSRGEHMDIGDIIDMVADS